MSSGNIITLAGKTPKIGERVFIAPNAVVIGDVEIGDDASIWFGCVLRGDVGSIRIGARTNIQDLSMIHMTDHVSNAEIGNDVTVGHGVILHGCSVGDAALVGMGSILLDGVAVGARALVAAGSLLTPRTVIADGWLARGNPAKAIREATAEEQAMGIQGALHYVENAKRYLPPMRGER
ncbi:MAG TPA: gamma carbonic anhydrase family protein [Polyangiaceae bacterium]|nr:gamma carbonic anhydrase family protein [Polyangiaceae bacterium]